jgi:hypothetical protein
MELKRRKAANLKIGQFCSIKEETRIKLYNSDTYRNAMYKSGPKRSRRSNVYVGGSFAHVDLFYVIDNKSFGIPGLLHVVPIGTDGRNNMSQVMVKRGDSFHINTNYMEQEYKFNNFINKNSYDIIRKNYEDRNIYIDTEWQK